MERPDDNSTDEIEITAAMIEAGRSELLEYDHDYESAESAVNRIYRAMTAAVGSFSRGPSRSRGQRR